MHRNSQKRYCLKNSVYFIVTKTANNLPYFKESIFCELLIEELKLCKKLKQFKLYAFCLIYDHLNLLIKPGDEYNILKIIKSLKENSSRDINYIIINTNSVGDTPACAKPKPRFGKGRSTCRLRLGKLLKNWQIKFMKKYKENQIRFPKFKWQKSFHDHVIRNENDF